MNNSEMPAYPLAEPEIYADNKDPSKGLVDACGLTKREAFAMAAMQGLCACSIAGQHKHPENVAKEAAYYADCLLSELEK